MTESVDDEDEVLIALSASLGKLVPHIGGPAFAHTLLAPLELLLTVGTLYMLYLIYIYILHHVSYRVMSLMTLACFDSSLYIIIIF